MIIYIAGPMTGLPEYNYPAFNTEARRLRDLGHTVLNPAETVLENPSYAAYMRRGIAQVLEAEAVLMLPGWSVSSGAKTEFAVAESLGLEILFADWQP